MQEIDIIGFITTFILERVFDWIIGGIIFAIILIFRPQISFRWAKIVFRIRGIRARFNIDFSMNYRLHPGLVVPSIHEMGELLRDLDHVVDIEFLQSDRGDSLRIELKLHNRMEECTLKAIEDIDTEEITAYSVQQNKVMDYKQIGDFVDNSIAVREMFNTTLRDIGISALGSPPIAIAISWDTDKFSIIPWLDQDYRFTGSIEVEDTEIVITQSEKEAVVRSQYGTSLFKEIIRNLVIDNYGK